MSHPDIEVKTKFIAPSDESLPALALQVTTLVDSYMIWIGVTDLSAEEVHIAPARGKLCQDWAVAMPSKNPSMPSPATSLFRSSSSDVALGMAQRLAKRFKKQIFLSVDVPSTFLTVGQGHKVLIDAEKAVVRELSSIETSGAVQPGSI